MMTNRDEFARTYMAAYVQGQLVQQSDTLGDHDPCKAIASKAYDMAEAMMQERSRRAELKHTQSLR